MEEKGKPLNKMTVKELREVAKEMGAEGVSGMKKEELLTFVKKEKGIAEERPKKIVRKKKKKVLSIRELKDKIKLIKGKRADALEKGDKRMATIHKRQVSRLKKRTRKAIRPAVESSE
jgi:hypothetical protein